MADSFWTPARAEIANSWKDYVEGQHTMALTKNLNRIGIAAHNEKLDFRSSLDEQTNPDSTHWLIKGDLEYRKLVAAVGKDEAYKMTCALDGTRRGRYDAIKELVSRYTVPPVAAAVERGS